MRCSFPTTRESGENGAYVLGGRDQVKRDYSTYIAMGIDRKHNRRPQRAHVHWNKILCYALQRNVSSCWNDKATRVHAGKLSVKCNSICCTSGTNFVRLHKAIWKHEFSVLALIKNHSNWACKKTSINAILSMQYRNLNTGRFPFTKNFGKFILGISVWEEHVPSVTSSIRGSRGMPGRLIRPRKVWNLFRCSRSFDTIGFKHRLITVPFYSVAYVRRSAFEV